jgi:hypothetical protein
MLNPAAATINVADYHAVANSGSDAFDALRKAIAAAKAAPKPVVLNFEQGIYDIYAATADKTTYYISNTVTYEESPNQTRTIGLLFKDINDITIQGNNTELMFHGSMTPIVFDHCSNVHMAGISVDFKRPVMSEITVSAIGGNHIEAIVHPDSWYSVDNGTLTWIGECGWSESQASAELAQQYDPTTKRTWRSWNPVSTANSVQDLGNKKIRFNYSGSPDSSCVIGHVYQIRNTSRIEEGAFIYRSRNVTWTDVNFYSAPGLGIVGQYSENLNFTRLNFSPRNGSGRTNASMADFMQFSGCKGNVEVINSNFFGAHDDPINIHGTHLRIVEKPAQNQIIVRFCHNQSWGFDAFEVNDTVDFIDGLSLLPYESAIVTGVTRVDDYNIQLTLDISVPENMQIDCHYVENATWTPNLHVSGCTFESVPTRGILCTTRGRVLIENNSFKRLTMSAVLISDDANSWCESGFVRDVIIRNNIFDNCGNSVISIEPSGPCTNPEMAVHQNITVTANDFYMDGTTNIHAAGVTGFNFIGNTAKTGGFSISCKGSKNVTITGNTFSQSNVSKEINFSDMYSNTDIVEPIQGFVVNRINNL